MITEITISHKLKLLLRKETSYNYTRLFRMIHLSQRLIKKAETDKKTASESNMSGNKDFSPDKNRDRNDSRHIFDILKNK